MDPSTFLGHVAPTSREYKVEHQELPIFCYKMWRIALHLTVYFTYYISNKRVNMENMYSVMYSYKRNYFAVLVRKWKLNTSWTAYGLVKPKSLTVVIIPVPFPVTKRKISLGPKSVFMLWMVRRDVSLLLTDQSGFLTSFAFLGDFHAAVYGGAAKTRILQHPLVLLLILSSVFILYMI